MDNKKHRALPDFLIIGAGKSGTTSLDNYLKQHPQVFIPSVKEPNFFGYERRTLADFDGDTQEIFHYRHSVTRLEPYLKLFAEAKSDQLKGETSNTYLYHEDAPERIKHYNPDIKLIAILRQPAERLWSRYLHLAREGRLPTKKFSDCLDKDTIWWRRNDLVREGFYYRNLSRYYDLFSPAQIRVYLYEEFQQEGQKVLADIFDFLQVDRTFEPDLSVRYNESGFIRNKGFDRVFGSRGILQNTAKSILKDEFFQKLKSNNILMNFVVRIRRKNLVRPRLDPKMRKILTHEIYGEDIRQLQSLLGTDLSSWKNV